MIPDASIGLEDLREPLAAFWPVSGSKIASLCRTWDPADGSPVFTVRGRYTSQGWTEWTQGFQFGSAILQFDATDDAADQAALAATVCKKQGRDGLADLGEDASRP